MSTRCTIDSSVVSYPVCDTCGAQLGPDAVTVNGTRTVCGSHFRPAKPPADLRELHRKLRRGERIELDHEPPFSEGDVFTYPGEIEVTILAVRRPKPDRWTVQTRRHVPALPRNLRAGPLPWRAEQSVRHVATPDEIEQAREESAYTHRGDVLDAGEAPSDRELERMASAARLRQAEAIRAEIEEAA